jgi:glutamyl-tRNA reductase
MLISLAVDFRSADVATREKYHLTADRVHALYGSPRDELIRELALVSTCNRDELYAWCDEEGDAALERATQELARRWMGTRKDVRGLLKIAKRRSGSDVARHLLRVASGLESQVIGDGQILGQVRSAYKFAAASHALGPVLHRLFEVALRTGKRVSAETSLSAGRNSIGAEAAAMALHRFGSLEHTRVVVAGAGKTSERTVRQLHKLGARDIVIVNRSPERAERLAKAVGGRVAPLEALHLELSMADIGMAATGSELPIIRAAELRQTRENCGTTGYALFLVDLSVPRNIEPACATLDGVTLVDLDALHIPIMAAEEMRRESIPAAGRIVEDEVRRFLDWAAASVAREAIEPLREAIIAIARREVAYVAGDSVAEAAARRIAAKMLARPMVALRGALSRGEGLDDFAEALDSLFDGARPAKRTIENARRASVGLRD